MFTNCLFDSIKSKLDCYKGEDCMKRFCKENYEKKEMMALTDEENKSYEKQRVCYIFKKEFNTDENGKNVFKLYHKVKDHCHYT